MGARDTIERGWSERGVPPPDWRWLWIYLGIFAVTAVVPFFVNATMGARWEGVVGGICIITAFIMLVLMPFMVPRLKRLARTRGYFPITPEMVAAAGLKYEGSISGLRKRLFPLATVKRPAHAATGSWEGFEVVAFDNRERLWNVPDPTAEQHGAVRRCVALRIRRDDLPVMVFERRHPGDPPMHLPESPPEQGPILGVVYDVHATDVDSARLVSTDPEFRAFLAASSSSFDFKICPTWVMAATGSVRPASIPELMTAARTFAIHVDRIDPSEMGDRPAP